MDVYWQVAAGTLVCVPLAWGLGCLIAWAWTTLEQKQQRKASKPLTPLQQAMCEIEATAIDAWYGEEAQA